MWQNKTLSTVSDLSSESSEEKQQEERFVAWPTSIHIRYFLLQSPLNEEELGFCFLVSTCQLPFLYHNLASWTLQALGITLYQILAQHPAWGLAHHYCYGKKCQKVRGRACWNRCERGGSRIASFYTENVGKQSIPYLHLTFKNKRKENLSLFAWWINSDLKKNNSEKPRTDLSLTCSGDICNPNSHLT